MTEAVLPWLYHADGAPKSKISKAGKTAIIKSAAKAK